MIISLKEYKDEVIYFSLFDILIKKVAPNRDIYLEDMDISPTTYKRCKNRLSKKGREIIQKLATHFGYKVATDEFIDELEERINRIYHNVYYKIESKYQEDIEYLDKLIEENYLINPILKLMKLFIIFNYLDDIKRLYVENEELYNEVKDNKSFYSSDLLELYEIFNILLLNDIDIYLLARKYKNELCYSALASKLFKNGKYIECLYLSQKIKLQYLQDENFKRLYSINLNIIACCNILGEYKQAYDLSHKEMLSLESLDITDSYYSNSEFHYLIACLGLGKYKEIVNILDYREKYNMKQLLILSIAKYKIGIDEYLEIYKVFALSKFLKDADDFMIIVNDIIYNKRIDKIELLSDPKYRIPTVLHNILKKMFS